MKSKSFFIILILLTLASCGRKDDKKLQAYNAEAFAFNLNDGWEINAAVRVKGFDQQENNSQFKAFISYTLDLKTPDGRTVTAVAQDTLKQEGAEEFADLPLEAQVELDSTYVKGNYRLIFNVKDELSGRQTTAEKEFELQAE